MDEAALRLVEKYEGLEDEVDVRVSQLRSPDKAEAARAAGGVNSLLYGSNSR